MSTMTEDISPARLLAQVKGPVRDAHLTYPERMQLDIADATGSQWSLISWEADYAPSDPEALRGKTVTCVDLDGHSEVLTVHFSDATCFTLTSIPDEEDDAIENWELFTPEGLVLTFGPRGRWQLSRASDPC